MKEEKEYRDNRGNVVLLTVIAIVTMVIVLVGATFAYLASSIEGSKSANINATTNAGSDLFLITPGADLTLSASEENFGLGMGNLSVNSTASILFQTTNTAELGVTKNYEVKLQIVENNFEYTNGTCYNKPAGSATEIVIDGPTSKPVCEAADGDTKWANDGSGFKCFISQSGFSPVIGDSYTNELSCLSRSSYIWERDEVAELVIDLYQNDENLSNQTDCIAVGACVNKRREIQDGLTEAQCVAQQMIWLPNIWEEGMCYHLTAAKDLTNAAASSTISLIESQSINARKTVNNGTTNHYYKPVVTFINFSHNQIINGKKSFGASLIFALKEESGS